MTLPNRIRPPLCAVLVLLAGGCEISRQVEFAREPTISEVRPDRFHEEETSAWVDVSGHTFTSDLEVTLNGRPVAREIASGRLIRAYLPLDSLGGPGLYVIAVSRPGAKRHSAAASREIAVYGSGPVPRIESTIPGTVQWGGVVEIHATEARSPFQLLLNGEVPIEVADARGELYSVTLGGEGEDRFAAGRHVLQVVNVQTSISDGGASGAVPVDLLPVIDSVFPGPRATGTPFTLPIRGSGFPATGMEVEWNGQPLDAQTLDSRTVILRGSGDLVEEPGTGLIAFRGAAQRDFPAVEAAVVVGDRPAPTPTVVLRNSLRPRDDLGLDWFDAMVGTRHHDRLYILGERFREEDQEDQAVIIEVHALEGTVFREWTVGRRHDTRIALSSDGSRLIVAGRGRWDRSGLDRIWVFMIDLETGSVARELDIGPWDGGIRSLVGIRDGFALSAAASGGYQLWMVQGDNTTRMAESDLFGHGDYWGFSLSPHGDDTVLAAVWEPSRIELVVVRPGTGVIRRESVRGEHVSLRGLALYPEHAVANGWVSHLGLGHTWDLEVPGGYDHLIHGVQGGDAPIDRYVLALGEEGVSGLDLRTSQAVWTADLAIGSRSFSPVRWGENGLAGWASDGLSENTSLELVELVW